MLLILYFLCLFQANGTFNALAMLKELADSWDEVGPRVWDFLQDSPQVNAIRVRVQRDHEVLRPSIIEPLLAELQGSAGPYL